MLAERVHLGGRLGEKGPASREKEERKSPDSSRSVLRQQTDPDGAERGGLYLRDKETLVDQHNIYLAHMHRRTQLCTVLFTLAQPLAPDRVGNVPLSASRALET